MSDSTSVSRARLSQQVIRFAGVGVISTALHLGLFAALVRGGAPSQPANGVALVIATVVNTGLNRAWTFGVSGRRNLVTHHGQALVITIDEVDEGLTRLDAALSVVEADGATA